MMRSSVELKAVKTGADIFANRPLIQSLDNYVFVKHVDLLGICGYRSTAFASRTVNRRQATASGGGRVARLDGFGNTVHLLHEAVQTVITPI